MQTKHCNSTPKICYITKTIYLERNIKPMIDEKMTIKTVRYNVKWCWFWKYLKIHEYNTHFFKILQAIEQAIKVVIPHQAKAIFESIKDIIDGFAKILNNPKEAIGNIGKGVIT